MANVIRIKRRLTGVSGAPAALSNAELAFNEINNTLYYGKGDDGSGNATSVIAIAGDGTFATKTYVDSAVAGSSPVGAAYLAQNNTFDAANTNTFNGTVNLEGVFQIDAVTVNTSAAELNVLDGVTAGTVTASKAIVVDANKSITSFKAIGAESLRLESIGGASALDIYDAGGAKTFGVTESGDISGNSVTTVNDGAIGGNLTVTGNLTVNGTTTTVNSTVVTVDDPLITVGGDTAPAADDNKDRGVAFRWHTGSAAKIGFFGFDDSSGYFTFVPDATITSEVVAGTVGTINVGGVFINGSQISASALSNGVTGTGAVVLATGPTITTATLVTPALGTPTSGTLTSCTGLPISTGVSGLGTGVATFLATPSSANLAGAVTDETGSGALVFATSPTLVTPSIGVATGTSFNSITGLSSTTPVVDGTAVVGVATTAARADHVHPTDTSRAATAGTLAQFAATTSAQLAGVISDETGTGALVFATSPTLVTPALGTPASGTLTSCTGLPISTGVSGLGTGVATFLATPSSANLISAVTDETGTGSLVFGTSPAITTPTITFSTSAAVTAGTNTQGQGALTSDYNIITTAAANPSGVTLPTATVGRRVIVVNKGANAINVYPATGGAVDALAANASIQIPVSGVMVFNAASTTLWYSTGNSTFTAPALGTPVSGTLTSCTGLPVSTGVSGLGTGVATFLATPSSANLISAVTDETGTGSLVFATSPTLTTPVLGTPSSGTLTSCTGLPISTGVSGLAAGVATFLATPSSANLITAVTDETGTGALVFATSPTLTTPVLGTPTSGTLTNCTGLPVSTGVSGLGTGVATFLATPSSANLISAVTDETGTGSLVFGTSPTITTSIVAGSASMNIFNTVATTVNAFGAATAVSLGAATGSTTINNNLVVTGNLTINGTTTTVNSTTVTVDDPIITLGGDTAPATDDGKDRGVEFRWHNGTAAKVGFFGFDDSTGKLAFIPDATNTSEVFSGALGTIDVGAVHISGSQIAASNLSNGVTGTGSIVLATSPSISSPTLTTPVLGTPASGTLTSCTGLPIGTGVSGLGTGVATFLATPSSANLISAVTDETGSGALVFGTSPTITTPTLTFSTSAAVTAGTNAQSQGALTSDYNVITTAAAAPSGVTLPTATVGRRVIIVNKGANAINVYPATGASVDALAANASIQIPVNGVMIFNAASTTLWYSTGNSTFTAPVLGTPATGTLTNCTGLPVSTGVSGLGTGVATFLTTPSSANFAAALTDETGTSSVVFSNSPTLTTPTLGVASATSINKVTITAPATSATITVADGKTFTCSNTLTFTGTDTSSVAFGAGGTVAYLGTANAFTGANTFTNATGQTVRAAATQDAIILQGRAGGTTSLAATLTTATLTANRTITFPDETGTVVTTASVCTAVSNCTLDGGTF